MDNQANPTAQEAIIREINDNYDNTRLDYDNTHLTEDVLRRAQDTMTTNPWFVMNEQVNTHREHQAQIHYGYTPSHYSVFTGSQKLDDEEKFLIKLFELLMKRLVINPKEYEAIKEGLEKDNNTNYFNNTLDAITKVINGDLT